MRLTLSLLLLASGLMLCSPASYGDWTSPHPLQQEKKRAGSSHSLPVPGRLEDGDMP